MRRILALAMLALTLAGGIMTFTASVTSVQAQDTHRHHRGPCTNDASEDIPSDPC
jgi:hypothetical protein